MNPFRFGQKTDNLFEAVLSLETVKEAEAFFRDLCTIDEIKSMSERWEIAKLVYKGLPYRKISDKLNVSTTTVSRVALWLNNGEGGYKAVLDKLNNK
ncbi:MAG: YerC/YecD family TrpR-related protein [Patescibacteria group bacterium]